MANMLKHIIFSLSEQKEIDDNFKQNIYLQLNEVYFKDKSEEYRHKYSDLFSWVFEISQDDVMKLDLLGYNITKINMDFKDWYINHSKDVNDLSKKLLKLDDHINLEIARILASNDYDEKEIYTDIEKRIKDINQKYSKLNDSIKKSECVINKIEKIESDIKIIDDITKKQKDLEIKHDEVVENIDNAKRETKELANQYITILGIFASIVLAFTGGIAFSTSVFENIEKASIFRIILIIVLLGFILINVLNILVWFIMKINDKEAVVFPKILKGVSAKGM